MAKAAAPREATERNRRRPKRASTASISEISASKVRGKRKDESIILERAPSRNILIAQALEAETIGELEDRIGDRTEVDARLDGLPVVPIEVDPVVAQGQREPGALIAEDMGHSLLQRFRHVTRGGLNIEPPESLGDSSRPGEGVPFELRRGHLALEPERAMSEGHVPADDRKEIVAALIVTADMPGAADLQRV